MQKRYKKIQRKISYIRKMQNKRQRSLISGSIGRATHIPLQVRSADVGDIEREESLSSANVQHVILLTEEQRGVIEDSIG